MTTDASAWPTLDFAAWKDTRATLHLWMQIAGKIRMEFTPWLNHSWHVTLYVTARGLTTSPIPWKSGTFEIDFDFIDHVLWLRASNGAVRQVMLKPVTVAEFYADVLMALRELGIDTHICIMPSEIPGALPFDQDTMHRSYDAEYANRFWRVLVSCDRVMKRFRTGFLGKASPVHLFWGSFDLAMTRFSGRVAPKHPGGVPNLPDEVTQEAYSHEESSAGFWAGTPGGPVEYAAFYSYAYPAPEGFAAARVKPADAFYSKELGEFLLPYDAVRKARDPEAALMDFLQSTYDAAADLGKWDRKSLDCATGECGKVRAV